MAGVTGAAGQVLAKVRTETPNRSTAPSVVEDTLVKAVGDLLDQHEVAAIGIGAAGFVDAAGSSVRFSPHLSWRDEALKTALEKRLRLPVFLDNDANTTAWAEMKFGAGRGVDQALCVTMGTGIGGALIINGQIYRGANGMAGEFGHMQVISGGRTCECGNRGCWEQYASGKALVREARELTGTRSPAADHLRELTGGDPDHLTGPMVTQAAHDGSLIARDAFASVGGWLGIGLASLTAAFDPELIIIGGGVSDAGDLLLQPAREALARTLTGRGFRPRPVVVKAQLGTDAGFIGAADLARCAFQD